MAKPDEAVRLAMNALALSEPKQRLDCFTALVKAREELAVWVGRCETWLNDEMTRLDTHLDDPNHEQDNARWMRRKVTYEEAFAVLQDALLMEKHLTTGEPRRVQRQLGEAPF